MSNDVKKRIISESMLLIYDHGVKTMTMDELAKRIGVSKRTIYEQFENKDALLTAVINHYKKYREAEHKKNTESSPTVIHAFFNSLKGIDSAMFSKMVSLYDEVKRYHPAVYTKIVENEKEEMEKAKEFFEMGIKQGVFRKDLNADITAFLLRNILLQLWDSKGRLNEQFSLENIFGEFVYIFIRGCCTEKGLKIVGNLESA